MELQRFGTEENTFLDNDCSNLERRYENLFGSRMADIEVEEEEISMHVSGENWVDKMQKDITTLKNSFREIDEYENKLLVDQVHKYQESKRIFMDLCNQTSEFCNDQIGLFESLDNEELSIDEKIEYVNRVKDGMNQEKCVEIIGICEKLQKKNLELKNSLESEKYKNKQTGMIVGGILGVMIGVGASLALPWMIPLEIGLVISSGIVVSAGASLLTGLYKDHSNKKILNQLKSLSDFVDNLQEQTTEIKIVYDRIKRCYKAITYKQNAILKEEVVNERKIDKFINFIEKNKVETIKHLIALSEYSSRFNF